jgi:Ca2+-binding EF-hand superfamily protein
MTVSVKSLRAAQATLTDVFRALDANQDGKVSAREFQKLRQSYEARTPVGYVLESAFAQGSGRGSRTVAVAELERRLGDSVERLQRADTNRSGTLSKAEIDAHVKMAQMGSSGRVDDGLYDFTRAFRSVPNAAESIIRSINSTPA